MDLTPDKTHIIMQTKQEIISELDYTTSQISTQVRVISAGLLAVVWALLVGDKIRINIGHRRLMAVAGLAIIVLFVDYLQYLFGYLNNKRILKKMEATGLAEGEYNPEDKFFCLRTCCFTVKQVLLILNVVLFVCIVTFIFPQPSCRF